MPVTGPIFPFPTSQRLRRWKQILELVQDNLASPAYPQNDPKPQDTLRVTLVKVLRALNGQTREGFCCNSASTPVSFCNDVQCVHPCGPDQVMTVPGGTLPVTENGYYLDNDGMQVCIPAGKYCDSTQEGADTLALDALQDQVDAWVLDGTIVCSCVTIDSWHVHVFFDIGPISVTLAGSNDGVTWFDLDATSAGALDTELDETRSLSTGPTACYHCYRVTFDATEAPTFTGFRVPTLEFLNTGSTVVPVMTSDTTPSGQASASSVDGANAAFKAFDDDSLTSWQSDPDHGRIETLQYCFAGGGGLTAPPIPVQLFGERFDPTAAFVGCNDFDVDHTGIVQVNVYRSSVSGGPYSLVGNFSLPLNNEIFDEGLDPDTDYFYVLRSLGDGITYLAEESGDSAEIPALH